LSLAGSLIHPDNKFPSPALFSDVCACVSVCVRVPVVDSSLWCVACPCFPHSILMFFNSSIKCISCSRRRGCDEFPDRSRRSQRCRVAAFPCLCFHSDSWFISPVSKYPRQRERAVKVARFILVFRRKKSSWGQQWCVPSALLELV
jgi:hypothetical protein